MNKIIKVSKSLLEKEFLNNLFPKSLFKTKNNKYSHEFNDFRGKRISLCQNKFKVSINNIVQYKSKINYLLYKMISESDNKRVLEGTKHTLNTSQKIGGLFKSQTNAPFISKRAALFDKMFAVQKSLYDSIEKKSIKITLKDGKVVEGKVLDSTPLTIAKANLKKSLVSDFIVAKVKYTSRVVDISKNLVDADEDLENPQHSNDENDGFELWDMDRGLEGDCFIEYLTFEDKLGKHVFWHSSAHVLGFALEKVYGSYLCIGPPLKEGFYYDSYMGNLSISEEKDYKLIEEAAESVIKSNHQYQRLNLTKNQALELFQDNPFKVQLISSKVPDNGNTTAYKCGDLIDLCMGPHLISTGVVKYLKVYKNSACYWLGNSENDSLQRVYGITFPNKELMEQWVKIKEEEAKRDHLKIGTRLDLFMFNELSPGSCFFFPDGAHLYNTLINLMRNEYVYRGFNEVITPNMYNIRLWKTSGHYKNYNENLFSLKVENMGFGLKPMNCPGHCLMFDSTARSYKELPIRYADFGVLHRNELSGALTGLKRVRRFQQDDAHIFINEDFILEEIMDQLDFLDYVYSLFGFKYDLFLSTRPDNAMGDEELWKKAEKALADALDKFTSTKTFKWAEDPKGGAFYGPKIDVKLYDALGRSHQCGTIQLDFQLPIRFNLKYRTNEQFEVNEEDKNKKKDDNKKKKEKKEIVKLSEEELLQQKQQEEKLRMERIEKLTKEGKYECYCHDLWDPEDFVWEQQELKQGYKRPVIIHRAILGSLERFISILIEHVEGKWPFWLSPKQAMVVSVSEKYLDYAKKVKELLKKEGFKVEVDLGKGNLQKKIAVAQTENYNYILVCGAVEESTQQVDVRDCRAHKDNAEIGKFSIPKLVEFFKSLSPPKSNAYHKLSNNCLDIGIISDIESIEPLLKSNLYIGGDEINDKDKEFFEKILSKEISLPDKNSFPNINKWYKLMSLSYKK